MTLQTVPVAQNVSPEYSTGTGSTSFFLPVLRIRQNFRTLGSRALVWSLTREVECAGRVREITY